VRQFHKRLLFINKGKRTQQPQNSLCVPWTAPKRANILSIDSICFHSCRVKLIRVKMHTRGLNSSPTLIRHWKLNFQANASSYWKINIQQLSRTRIWPTPSSSLILQSKELMGKDMHYQQESLTVFSSPMPLVSSRRLRRASWNIEFAILLILYSIIEISINLHPRESHITEYLSIPWTP